MSDKYLMSYIDSAARWFKKINGQQIAVTAGKLVKLFPSLCTGESKSGTWRAANAWWQQKLAEMAKQDGRAAAIQDCLELAAAADFAGDVAGAESMRGKAAELESGEGPIHKLDRPLAGTSEDARWVWMDRQKNLERAKQKQQTTGETFETYVKLYLDSQKAKAGTLDLHRMALNRFIDVCSLADPKQLNAIELLKFHNEFSKLKLAFATKRSEWAIIRTFIRWLWELEIINELPRNIDRLKIEDTEGEADTMYIPFTQDEIKKVMDGSNERQKLYWLMMLNCGMTQIDIADLRHHEVDWGTGRIIRQRSKTGSKKRKQGAIVKTGKYIPTVNHKLWKETFTLLKKFRSQHPDFVLTTRNGNTLNERKKREQDEKHGKPMTEFKFSTRRDPIGLNFRRLKARLKIEKPMKSLRKTAATVLDNHKEFCRYAQHFLGQSPRTVAEKHYVTPSEDRFDMALEWLGQQFGFAN